MKHSFFWDNAQRAKQFWKSRGNSCFLILWDWNFKSKHEITTQYHSIIQEPMHILSRNVLVTARKTTYILSGVLVVLDGPESRTSTAEPVCINILTTSNIEWRSRMRFESTANANYSLSAVSSRNASVTSAHCSREMLWTQDDNPSNSPLPFDSLPHPTLYN